MGPAIPANQISRLPSTADQYRALRQQIQKGKPAVESARQKSARLAAQALSLKRKLIATAARVQSLEAEKISLDGQIARLSAQEKALSESFARDRVSVSHLLAILERLQTDMPPAMALNPDDALGAARGAMVLGSSLPRVYGAAAALARKLDALRQTRAELTLRRAQGVRNAADLRIANRELDQLLAIKELQAQQAQSQYGDLQAKLDAVAGQASDLEALLAKVAALRKGPAANGVVVVAARQAGDLPGLERGALRPPVIGRPESPSEAGPGLTFVTAPGAQVVAPSDANVLFAGPYHKTGQVLILETGGGYDLVLAGLDRIDVRPGDQLLAGEPLGTMPKNESQTRLYFELRQNGRALNPAPWLAGTVRKAKRS
jgi:septal ring factor EnvC (AmiA/AmiB activator)